MRNAHKSYIIQELPLHPQLPGRNAAVRVISVGLRRVKGVGDVEPQFPLLLQDNTQIRVSQGGRGEGVLGYAITVCLAGLVVLCQLTSRAWARNNATEKLSLCTVLRSQVATENYQKPTATHRGDWSLMLTQAQRPDPCGPWKLSHEKSK